MSLVAVVNAMVTAGCSAEQIAAAVAAHQSDVERATCERRAKAAEKKALQRAEAEAKKALNVPGTNGDVPGTSGDNQGRKGTSDAEKKNPTPHKKNSPSPSAPKGASVDAPAGGSGPASRGFRLPDDFAPDDDDLAYGRKLGLTAAQMASSLEDMQRWAWANVGAKVRKCNWHLTLKGFFKRDAGRLGARAGPSHSRDGIGNALRKLDEAINGSEHHDDEGGHGAAPADAGPGQPRVEAEQRGRGRWDGPPLDLVALRAERS